MSPRTVPITLVALLLLQPACGDGGGARDGGPPADSSAGDGLTTADTTAPDTEPAACIELDDDIDSETTLDQPCYLVKRDLTVSAALRIQAGVTLRFTEKAGLSVDSAGSIRAIGSAAKPIRFTGEQATRGYWRGIRLYNSDDVENHLEQVIIEHGGGYEPAYGEPANLMLTSSGQIVRVKLIDVTLQESGGYGLFLGDKADLGQMTGCTLTKNKLGPARVTPHSARFLDDNGFSGNDEDLVVIDGDAVSQPVTWPAIDVPYLHRETTSVDAQLTLAPGVTVHFDDKGGIDVNSSGALTAVGTEDKPILLRGAQQTPGFWRGVRIYNSDRVGNHLEQLTIADAGSYAPPYGEPANLMLTSSGSPVQLKLVAVTLTGGAGYGLFLADTADISQMTGCTLTNNQLGPAHVTSRSARFLGDDNAFTGNDADLVVIDATSVEQDLTWPALDVPYLHRKTTSVDAVLTIAAGASIHFDQQTGIDVNADGALTAVGTSEAPIVLRGDQQLPGYWRGVRIYNSYKVENQLEQVTISHGGGYEPPYGKPANLMLTSSGSPLKATISGCTFSDSAGFGLWHDVDADLNADLASANTFSGNASGDVGSGS